MKYIAACFVLLLWALFVLALAISVIGMVVLVPFDAFEHIPKKALKVFET